jgi:hypothetical protein
VRLTGDNPRVATEFLIEDEGDGWWHSPSPIRAVVLDGPSPYFPVRPDARWPETYWLVRTDPPIEWNGDERFATRWGPDHPLCHPAAPTSLALVMASSAWSGPVDTSLGGGIPVYPVTNEPSRVEDAQYEVAFAIKAGLRAVQPPG